NTGLFCRGSRRGSGRCRWTGFQQRQSLIERCYVWIGLPDSGYLQERDVHKPIASEPQLGYGFHFIHFGIAFTRDQDKTVPGPHGLDDLRIWIEATWIILGAASGHVEVEIYAADAERACKNIAASDAEHARHARAPGISGDVYAPPVNAILSAHIAGPVQRHSQSINRMPLISGLHWRQQNQIVFGQLFLPAGRKVALVSRT